MIYDFDFHPPDDARLFRMPAEGVRRSDEEAFVAEVSYGDVIVRHYAFRDHWFQVNCTLESDANLIETTSPEGDVPPFAFNCDIATPMLRRDNAVSAVDLWLGILVRRDGATYGVYDKNNFDEAVQRAWLSRREAASAQFVDFLAAGHPFGPAAAPAAPEMQRVRLSAVAVLQPDVVTRGESGSLRFEGVGCAQGLATVREVARRRDAAVTDLEDVEELPGQRHAGDLGQVVRAHAEGHAGLPGGGGGRRHLTEMGRSTCASSRLEYKRCVRGRVARRARQWSPNPEPDVVG